MSLENLFETFVETARGDESALAAAKRMHQHAVGSLVVVDEMGYPVGIVTDRDLVSKVMAVDGVNPTTAISQIMTSPVTAAKVSDTVDAAVAKMAQQGVRRLPVVDDNGKLAAGCLNSLHVDCIAATHVEAQHGF